MLAASFLPVFGLLAFLALARSGEQAGPNVRLLVIFAVVATLGPGYQMLAWAFRTYTVENRQLVVDEGILSRRRRVVPYHRVQQVDTHQNLVSQLFGVAELRVATAGEVGATNVRLSYLEVPDAEGLRTHILSRRAEERAVATSADEGPLPAAGTAGPDAHPTSEATVAGAVVAPPASLEPPVETLLSLPPARLVLAAVTESSLIIAAISGVVVWLWLGAGMAAGVAGAQLVLLLGGGLVAALGVALFAGAWTIAGRLVARYGYTVSISGDDLHLRFGLFEVRNLTVPRRRVQHITVTDNPVRRALGLVSLRLRTASAGGGGGEGATSFEVPLLAREDLHAFLTRLMGDASWVPPELQPRTSRARGRAVRRRCLVLALLLLGPVVVLFPLGLALLPLALAGIPWGLVAHRRAGHAISPTLACTSHGAVHHRLDLVPLSRVQSCRTRASPFQRVAGLATWHIDVAGTTGLLFGFGVGTGGFAPHLYDLDAREADELLRRVPRAARSPDRAGIP